MLNSHSQLYDNVVILNITTLKVLLFVTSFKCQTSGVGAELY